MSEERAPGRSSALRIAVRVAGLSGEGTAIRHEAGEAERRAVAEELGILEVEALAADLVARRWRRDGVAVAGRLRAKLAQACVVTLDPVRETIDEPVELHFVPEGSPHAAGGAGAAGDRELDLDPDGADVPETFRGDTIDLGSVLVELLALAMDPYPKADGVEFGEFDTDPDPDGGSVSPFAALRDRAKPGGD